MSTWTDEEIREVIPEGLLQPGPSSRQPEPSIDRRELGPAGPTRPEPGIQPPDSTGLNGLSLGVPLVESNQTTDLLTLAVLFL